MNRLLPTDVNTFMDWDWTAIEPYYENLNCYELSSNNIADWLTNWSQLKALIQEAYARIDTAAAIKPEDESAQTRRQAYFSEICQPAWELDVTLEQHWITSRLTAPGYENQLQNLVHAKTRHWPDNADLEAEENKLTGEYVQLFSGVNISWGGEEINRRLLREHLLQPNRQTRSKIWKTWNLAQQNDRAKLEQTWQTLIKIRHQIARNAGFPNYLAYRWQRDDRKYSIADYQEFQVSIATQVVPAATEIYARYCNDLEIETFRPWDRSGTFSFDGPAAPLGTAELRPHQTIRELTAGVARIFQNIDPKLGEYFNILYAEGYLDLEPHPTKGPGGNARHLAVSRRSLISMGVTNLHTDVMGLLHEVGHAFEVFETAHRSYLQLSLGDRGGSGEWSEFAAQTMEFLALPFLHIDHGGFYNDQNTARAQIDRFENTLLFMAHIGMVDRFEHWAYTHTDESVNPECCRQKWKELWHQYIPGIDWSDLETEQANTWLTCIPMFVLPLYYAGYGVSLLGSLQLWQRAQHDQSKAVAAYRRALSQGGLGLSVPELYASAGIQIRFDANTIQTLVSALEKTIHAVKNS